MEVWFMTMRERQRQVQLYRGQIPSPGRPTVVAWREDRDGNKINSGAMRPGRRMSDRNVNMVPPKREDHDDVLQGLEPWTRGLKA